MMWELIKCINFQSKSNKHSKNLRIFEKQNKTNKKELRNWCFRYNLLSPSKKGERLIICKTIIRIVMNKIKTQDKSIVIGRINIFCSQTKKIISRLIKIEIMNIEARLTIKLILPLAIVFKHKIIAQCLLLK